MSFLTEWMNKLAEYLVFELFNLQEGLRITEALLYFIPTFILLSLLLVAVIYVMSIVNSYLSFDNMRNYLWQHKKSGFGNLLASMLGAITPFCSCSSVPIFIGMMQAKIPLGIALSFLITSPMVNEVAIVVFWATYGWQVTLIYIASGIVLGIAGGMMLEKLGLAESVADWVKDLSPPKTVKVTDGRLFSERFPAIHKEAYGTLFKLVPFVFLGILVGSFIHGLVPESFFEETISVNNSLAVPIAVLMAIPLYIDAVTVLPVIESLVEKGVPLGTAIAFMMGSIGLSLPSAILLKKVMKMKLIVSFFVTIGAGMILSGYLFNMVF